MGLTELKDSPTRVPGQTGSDSRPTEAETSGTPTVPAPETTVEAVQKPVTEISTTQPALPVPDTGNSQLLWGSLAVVFALLAAVIVVLLRRKNDAAPSAAPKPQQTVPIVPAASQPVSSASPASAPVQVAYYQHTGARENQQDSYAVSSPAGYDRQGVLAVVADGMGGLSNGSAVSAAVVRTFMDTFRSVQAPAGEVLLEAAARANEHVNQMIQGGEKSGSTLVAAIIREGRLSFLSVGDSRIYLYRGGALLQLSREHAYREELAVRAVNHEIPIGRVRGDRQSQALTSFFGIGTIPQIDRNNEAIRLLSGDRLLLASDGVFGALTESQLEAALALELSESAKQIEALICQADLPHQDNHTAVIVQYKVHGEETI